MGARVGVVSEIEEFAEGHLGVEAEIAIVDGETGVEDEGVKLLASLLVADFEFNALRVIPLPEKAPDVDAGEGGEADAQVVIFPRLEAEGDGDSHGGGGKVGVPVVGVGGAGESGACRIGHGGGLEARGSGHYQMLAEVIAVGFHAEAGVETEVGGVNDRIVEGEAHVHEVIGDLVGAIGLANAAGEGVVAQPVVEAPVPVEFGFAAECLCLITFEVKRERNLVSRKDASLTHGPDDDSAVVLDVDFMGAVQSAVHHGFLVDGGHLDAGVVDG